MSKQIRLTIPEQAILPEECADFSPEENYVDIFGLGLKKRKSKKHRKTISRKNKTYKKHLNKKTRKTKSR